MKVRFPASKEVVVYSDPSAAVAELLQGWQSLQGRAAQPQLYMLRQLLFIWKAMEEQYSSDEMREELNSIYRIYRSFGLEFEGGSMRQGQKDRAEMLVEVAQIFVDAINRYGP